jgi:hypothetical protein
MPRSKVTYRESGKRLNRNEFGHTPHDSVIDEGEIVRDDATIFDWPIWEALEPLCGKLSHEEKQRIAREIRVIRSVLSHHQLQPSRGDVRLTLRALAKIDDEYKLMDALSKSGGLIDCLMLLANYELAKDQAPNTLKDRVKYAADKFEPREGGRPANVALEYLAKFAVQFFQDRGLPTSAFSRGDDLNDSSNLVKFTALLDERFFKGEPYKSFTGVARAITEAEKLLRPRSN